MELFGETLSVSNGIFLLLALGLALSFEFVNGFHDTANAVATVIYTHSLKPMVAVVWSGCWNLIGVLTSTGAVAGVRASRRSDLRGRPLRRPAPVWNSIAPGRDGGRLPPSQHRGSPSCRG